MVTGGSPWLIVCVSHLEWTESLFQRPQQVMQRLSRDHSVLFSYPVALRVWSAMLRQGESVPRRLDLNANLTLLRDRSLLPALGGRFPRFQRFNDLSFMRSVSRAVSSVPPERRILWFYYPQFLELIETLNPRAVVYECMDNYAALLSGTSNPAHVRTLGAIHRDEPELLKQADIVFYGAGTLMDERPAYRAKSHHVPTGVDAQHFARVMTPDAPAPADVRGIRRPILGYWGAVDNRIDFELLTRAAIARPDWSFVLLGPLVSIERESIDGFLRLPNIHWLGPKRYDDIPNYAQTFDVCLLPFKVGEEGRYLNPTKTLEYLATGKPVISTPIPDVVRFYADTVAVARTWEDFVETTDRLLSNDSDSARGKRLAAAQDRSWEAMAASMWSLVERQIRAKGDTPPAARR